MQNENRKRHVSHKNAPFSPATVTAAAGYTGDDDENRSLLHLTSTTYINTAL